MATLARLQQFAAMYDAMYGAGHGKPIRLLLRATDVVDLHDDPQSPLTGLARAAAAQLKAHVATGRPTQAGALRNAWDANMATRKDAVWAKLAGTKVAGVLIDRDDNDVAPVEVPGQPRGSNL